jgi:hypothetical protein
VAGANTHGGLAVSGTSSGTTAAQFTSASSTDQATLDVVGGVTLSTGTVASTTAVTKSLLQQNTPKAWADIACNAGAVSVSEGFNVSSVAVVATNLEVTLAAPLAGTNFGCVICTNGSNHASIILQGRLATSAGVSKVTILGWKASTNAAIDFSAAGNYVIQFVAFGVQ